MSYSRRRFSGFSSRVRRVALRDDPLCYLCGDEPSTQVDHVVPWAEGGSDERDNARGIGERCHAIKSRAERLRGAQRHNAKGKRPTEPHPSER